MPKISIIIPAYNHAQELAATLESLREQTEQDFEVIVVDDGSTDGTADLFSAHTPLFPYTFIRFEENRGAPAARNEGFRNSSGEFVMFLDADAILIPAALQKMAQALETHSDVSFVYPSFHWGNRLFRGRIFDPEALKDGNYIHTSALIRREAFTGFDEALKKFQDWDLFLSMSKQGSVGLWIDEPLYRITPRKQGMSQWLPAFMYRLPWFVISWQPRTIRRYREAEARIKSKYNFPGAERENVSIPWLLLIVLYELATFAIFTPALRDGLALAGAVIMFFIAWKRPVFALSLMSIEYIIGGKGRGLALGANDVNDGGLALRILLFIGFFAGWLIHAYQSGRLGSWRKFFSERWALIILALVLVVALAIGAVRQNPFLIVDANAWGVLLLAWPIWELATAYPKKFRTYLSSAVLTALAWLSLKTFVLFYIFSHDFDALRQILYYWIRRAGVGEITSLQVNGGASRLFFQSHVYVLLASVALLPSLLRERVSRLRLLGLTGLLAVLLITLSRSFWLSLTATAIFLIIYVLRRKERSLRSKFIRLGRLFSRSFVATLCAVLIVLGSLWIPIRFLGGVNLVDLLFSRAATTEAAAMSRWSMLPILWDKITASPIFGHGFGSTVTYVSSDPRIVAATGGLYTTYAFEWGWLDLWIKLGLPGLIVMLWLLLDIARHLLRSGANWELRLGLSLSVLALALVHIFTPYLNHPLGLFYLMMLDAWAASTDETQYAMLSQTQKS